MITKIANIFMEGSVGGAGNRQGLRMGGREDALPDRRGLLRMKRSSVKAMLAAKRGTPKENAGAEAFIDAMDLQCKNKGPVSINAQ